MNRSEAGLSVAVLVTAVVLLISSLAPAPAMATDAVQCGAGVTNRCGEKCVDRTFYGACNEWHDIYNRTGEN